MFGAPTFWADLGPSEQQALLRRPAVEADASIREQTQAIVTAVQADGDQALLKFTQQFDGAELQDFRVSAEEFEAAQAQFDEQTIAAFDLAISNVRRFHEQLVPQDISIETMPGVLCMSGKP